MKEEFEDSEVIVLKNALNKIPGMVSKIEPCRDPKTKMYPKCVKQVDSNGDMILSDEDRKNMNTIQFIPVNEPITVYHGITFHMNNPLERSQWEAIRHSPLIAPERTSKDHSGNLLIDGGTIVEDKNHNPSGRYGEAEFYVERPGVISKARNDFRVLKNQAESKVIHDSLEHRVLICTLFGKNMKNANANDVFDYLLTKAGKEPEVVLKYYDAAESSVRYLIIMAQEKKVITQTQDGLYYSERRLGNNIDSATNFLKLEGSKAIVESIKRDTFPEYEAAKEPRKTKQSKSSSED